MRTSSQAGAKHLYSPHLVAMTAADLRDPTFSYATPNRANLAAYFGGRAVKAVERREPNNAKLFARPAAHHALELLGRTLLRGRGGCSGSILCKRVDHDHRNDVDSATYFAGACACDLA